MIYMYLTLLNIHKLKSRIPQTPKTNYGKSSKFIEGLFSLTPKIAFVFTYMFVNLYRNESDILNE